MASPGVRTVVIASLGLGLVIGLVEVGVPAFAVREGNSAAGGMLVGLWAVTSACFGVVFGLRPFPRSLAARLPTLLAGFSILVLPMAAAGSLVLMSVALLVSGAFIAPQTTTQHEAVERVAAPDRVIESFGWVITSSTVGIGLGHAMGGTVVDRAGVAETFVVAAVAGSALALIVFCRRSTVSVGHG